MFEQLSDKLDAVLRNIRGLGKISEKNIKESSRQIRRALLDADVHVDVAKDFIKRVEKRALGTTVTQSVKPGEQFVKILQDELIGLLGTGDASISFAKQLPTVILMAGLQGAGKTTTCAKLAHKLTILH